ncbi:MULTISPECIES: TonB-dependent siderophore receptor [unclassified Pseudomonas]|uniref:TonB-dependent siderophore receptor n=1 Tax=unclassified Pseudomonas TaxID=196821 RepID=UPI002447CBA1|nr:MULTISPECIES: TonB-dependent siderophore receptor [unclassified Pseudomonas]MDG9930327.1 TonB-dependent receptor [Pseudomonas sp. GD04042]MDH0484560.1 TonB-dependent receptor [Pseudomonas sp. GD04015]MDH0605982.1 TonB-dependent receptor [Pseudomonas sp. GD03869]
MTLRKALRPRLSPISIGLLLAATMAPQVQAQDWNLNIPAQPLTQALQALGEQANIQILYDPNALHHLRSNALSGRYQLDESIKVLLQGTGITYDLNGNVLTLQSPASSSLELPTVAISGKAPGSTTEDTGSYTTYSTSSSTRLNLSLQETPQSITVLTHQRLEDQRLDTVAAALDATTGIVVQSVQVGEDSPDIIARGSRINNFQIDGIPTSSSLSSDLQDTSIYDRIEVVRGATGLMSGLGLPSATVNLIRKRPTLEPQAQLSAEAGSWDRYGVGADVSGPLNDSGTIRGRLVADYKSQHAWVDRFDQDYYVLYGISEFDLGENTLLTAGFSHLTRDTNSPVRPYMLFYSDGQRIKFDPSDNKSPSWSYYNHDLDNVFASLEHTFDSGWSTKVEYSHTRYRYDAIVTNVLGTVDPVTGAGTELYPAHWKSDIDENTLDGYVTGPFSLFGREHELIAGVTLSQLHAESPDFWETDIYAIPNYHEWADKTPKPGFTKEGKSENDEYQYSAYLSTRLHLTDATSLILGSRVTDWKIERDYKGFDGFRQETQSRESGVFIPYAGVVHALDDVWSLYASYTKIFQPQMARVIQYTGGSPIDPEEGTSYEAGVKASFYEGRLTSSLAVFRTEQDNLAIWNNDMFTYDIVSGTKTQGVELELNGELAEGWQFTGGYAYSVTTDEHDDRILTRIPRHNVKTFTTYRLPGAWSKLTVGGGLNWQSKIGENLHAYSQDSYFLANLMARYDISKNLSASVHVNNLFDKEYFMGVSSNYGTYGPPRNVMTSLKYNF